MNNDFHFTLYIWNKKQEERYNNFFYTQLWRQQY